jgi:hypothetical protein
MGPRATIPACTWLANCLLRGGKEHSAPNHPSTYWEKATVRASILMSSSFLTRAMEPPQHFCMLGVEYYNGSGLSGTHARVHIYI